MAKSKKRRKKKKKQFEIHVPANVCVCLAICYKYSLSSHTKCRQQIYNHLGTICFTLHSSKIKNKNAHWEASSSLSCRIALYFRWGNSHRNIWLYWPFNFIGATSSIHLFVGYFIFLLISVRLTRFPRVAFIFYWTDAATKKKLYEKIIIYV